MLCRVRFSACNGRILSHDTYAMTSALNLLSKLVGHDWEAYFACCHSERTAALDSRHARSSSHTALIAGLTQHNITHNSSTHTTQQQHPHSTTAPTQHSSTHTNTTALTPAAPTQHNSTHRLCRWQPSGQMQQLLLHSRASRAAEASVN